VLYGAGGKPGATAWYGELSAYMGGMQCCGENIPLGPSATQQTRPVDKQTHSTR